MVTAWVFDEGGFRALRPEEHCAPLLAHPNTVIWFDAEGDSPEVRSLLRDTLKIHPLTVEDIFEEAQSPKIEDYGEYLYVVLHGVRGGPDELNTVELDVVIGRNWLFTHHDQKLACVEEVAGSLQRNTKQMERGPSFVAHALLDRLTDTYLPVVDAFEERVDDLEKEVVQSPDRSVLPRLFGVKRSLQRLRRISVYQRDMLQRLSRGDYQVLPKAVLPFYRDVYDHFVRIADFADSYRELVTAALDIYMSGVANRTNDVMKALTVISTIMLPLNFIVGFYGMNVDLPGQKWPHILALLTAVMATVSLGLLWSFKRRRWV
jgi:magnesium transporter